MRFISKYKGHTLIKKIGYKEVINGHLVIYPSERIQFINGVYETNDLDEINFIKNHPEFGISITTAEADVKISTRTSKDKLIEAAVIKGVEIDPNMTKNEIKKLLES